MELQTRLRHIHSEAEFRQVLEEHATTSIQSQGQVESILNAFY
jgi:hypothetical protein